MSTFRLRRAAGGSTLRGGAQIQGVDGPPSATLALVGGIPGLRQAIVVPSAILTLAGATPSVAYAFNPPAASLALVGGVPTTLASFRTLIQPFDLGSAYNELTQLFDMLGPPVGAELFQPFDLVGAVGSSLDQPFDLLGPVGSSLIQNFDLGSPAVNEIQTIVPGGVVSGGTYTLTFDGQTTAPIAGGASASAVQAALEALSNLATGDVVVTGGPLTTGPLVLTFGGTLANVDVQQVTVDATGLTGTDPTAIGSTATNGGVLSVVGGMPIGLIPLLWNPLMVFDKAGVYLGSIDAFNVTSPPTRYLRSRRIQSVGGMTFHVSRHSPDIGLIASDRLVLLQSLAGEDPWVGTMSVQPSSRGVIEVECLDQWTLLRDGESIVLEEIVDDGTPVTGVIAKIMALHNDLRGKSGEAQWETDLQGARSFRGNIDFDGSTLSCLDIAIDRSRTEVACSSRLDGNRLVLILRSSDRFETTGATMRDEYNVTAGVQAHIDPTPLRFKLRLTGQTTDLAACLPDWAEWALLDVDPEAVAEVDPGEFRMREMHEMSVDWGLSNTAVEAQCQAILDWLWELYRSFLRAFHDIEGRPWHRGWAYDGPPNIYEPKSAGKDSLSRRAWKTRLQLVEVRENEPASAVMISEQSSQINLREWLIVRYNRVTGVKNVTVWAIETVAGASLIKWNLTGSATLYKVSGGRVVSRSTISTTGAFVDPYNVRVYDPIARRYRNLRRIINGPFALAYYIDSADPDNAFVDLGSDAAISQRAGDGSSLIDKTYPFELLAIGNWDPRRDGIGALLARPTVYFGAPTTRPRWHIVSFNVGGSASTALTSGISAGDQDFEVDSIFGFPDPDLDTVEFPFLVTIDDGLSMELVLVLSMTGTLWHVLRGQGGTDAIIHESGAPVARSGSDKWDGFPWAPELLAWPEGQEWAAEELAELSKQRIDIDLHVIHDYGDQLTINYGSLHPINVPSEGPPGRWVGVGRAIGWSTNPDGGETELITEWVQ